MAFNYIVAEGRPGYTKIRTAFDICPYYISSLQKNAIEKTKPPRFSREGFFMTRKVVGAIGFEPTTPCTPCRCATGLRHAPTVVLVYQTVQRSVYGLAHHSAKASQPAHLPTGELFHHFLHLPKLVKELVDLLNGGAAPCGNPTLTGAV